MVHAVRCCSRGLLVNATGPKMTKATTHTTNSHPRPKPPHGPEPDTIPTPRINNLIVKINNPIVKINNPIVIRCSNTEPQCSLLQIESPILKINFLTTPLLILTKGFLILTMGLLNFYEASSKKWCLPDGGCNGGCRGLDTLCVAIFAPQVTTPFCGRHFLCLCV